MYSWITDFYYSLCPTCFLVHIFLKCCWFHSREAMCDRAMGHLQESPKILHLLSHQPLILILPSNVYWMIPTRLDQPCPWGRSVSIHSQKASSFQHLKPENQRLPRRANKARAADRMCWGGRMTLSVAFYQKARGSRIQNFLCLVPLKRGKQTFQIIIFQESQEEKGCPEPAILAV